MTHACQKTVIKRGIVVAAMSSDGHSPVCTIGHRVDVKHVITITNLRLYPANISCTGKMQNMPRCLDFLSSDPTDTKSSWSARVNNVLAGGTPTVFDHVKILSHASGSNQVDAEVTIDWPQPGHSDVVYAPITVKG